MRKNLTCIRVVPTFGLLLCCKIKALVCVSWCRRDLVSDVVGCCSLDRAPAAVDAALQCIIQMAAAPALQVAYLCFNPAFWASSQPAFQAPL